MMPFSFSSYVPDSSSFLRGQNVHGFAVSPVSPFLSFLSPFLVSSSFRYGFLRSFTQERERERERDEYRFNSEYGERV